MIPHSLHILRKTFSHKSKSGSLTLHTTLNNPKDLLRQAQILLTERKSTGQRVTGNIPDASQPLFFKSSTIKGWKSKTRMTLGLQRAAKHGGGYDWPLEELLNSIHANTLGLPTAQIFGFGYRRHHLGWIEEFFMITELLGPYVNGRDWLEAIDNKAEDFVNHAARLILLLHDHNVIHLDPWTANFMINHNDPGDLRIIDLENCILAPTRHLEETLGIQLGILFKETYPYITEQAFDKIVQTAIDKSGRCCGARFRQAYRMAKNQNIARKARRKISLSGLEAPI